MIDTKMPMQVVLQVLPHMGAGGLVRGAIDAAAAQVGAGWVALVASEGGNGVRELERLGARHFELPLSSKNPVIMYRNVQRLRSLVKEHQINLLHARSRAPAWSALAAARQSGIPLITTFHGTYSHRSRLKRRYNRVMTLGDGVISISQGRLWLRWRPSGILGAVVCWSGIFSTRAKRLFLPPIGGDRQLPRTGSHRLLPGCVV